MAAPSVAASDRLALPAWLADFRAVVPFVLAYVGRSAIAGAALEIAPLWSLVGRRPWGSPVETAETSAPPRR